MLMFISVGFAFSDSDFSDISVFDFSDISASDVSDIFYSCGLLWDTLGIR